MFANERLILPRLCTPSSSWRDLGECRWNSPSCLTSIEPLSTSFPSCKELFVTILDVQDASTADVLDEICCRHIYPQGHPDIPRTTIKALLLTLSEYPLTASQLDERFRRLARMELVPVRKSGASKFSAFTDPDWFIPDRLRYANSFQGKLWILDFEKSQIDSLKGLFERIGLTGREISRHVTEETITEGECAALPHIDKELQAKARYIAL